MAHRILDTLFGSMRRPQASAPAARKVIGNRSVQQTTLPRPQVFPAES
jgi:hypothetical protein